MILFFVRLIVKFDAVRESIVRFDAVIESRHQLPNPDEDLSAKDEWQLLPTCRYCRGVRVKETLFLEIYAGA
jgi:hypothetical protein